MTDPGGKLHIRLDPDGVTIASTRPVRAAGLLVGRGIAETPRLLPSLFSICATAQATACVSAIEQALGLTTDPEVQARRLRLVAAETLREHLWRILLDWPRMLGEPPDAGAMALVMASHGIWKAALGGGGDLYRPGAAIPAIDGAEGAPPPGDLTALVTSQVFGLGPARWRAQVKEMDDLSTWAARTPTTAARLVHSVIDTGWAGLGRSRVDALPQPRTCDLDRHLSGQDQAVDAFVAAPIWEGRPRETSPLTRQQDQPLVQDLKQRFGNGLLARLAAQLTEAARIMTVDGSTLAGPPPVPASLTTGLPGGVGLAMIQAARGLLVHRVRVDNGCIADYRILAPTEWNFHPQGVVAVGLAGLMEEAPTADLEWLARLFIIAVDPCVDFELQRGSC
jgi:coenzyme F420-reducing hydrogenase alpha subunit